MRDLAAFYIARREHRSADLPELRQYREYVEWQHANASGPAVTAAREFWRENLRGARVLPTPTDRPRPADGEFHTPWHRFLLEDELKTATAALASQTRSSSFMVLYAAFLAYQRDQTGVTDLVVPTFAPGRNPAWVQHTVGSFYNFLPLRTDLAGCTSFRAVVARVRASCLAAYAHELPFIQIMGEAPELMTSVMQPNGAPVAFQLIQSPFMMGGEQVGDLQWVAMRRRLLSQPVGSQIPDGILWALEPHPAGGIVGKIGFTDHTFDESTIVGMVAGFRRTLRDAVLDPDRLTQS
jgi:non-ribosomal peptide synthetase component F